MILIIILAILGFSTWTVCLARTMRKLDERLFILMREEAAFEKEREQGNDLNSLRDRIHDNAVEHGWWESDRNFSEVVALCHSELSEALEEDRKGTPIEYVLGDNGEFVTDVDKFNGRKTEGIAVEMADCMIRILDWFGRMKIDATGVVLRKMEYNKHRPYKHGKRF